MPDRPLVLTLAATGASGALLTRLALEMLATDARVGRVDFVASEHSRRVAREELGLQAEGAGAAEYAALLLGSAGREKAGAKVVAHDARDIGAAIASGSRPGDGMLVAPCSMGTLAAIAHGGSDNLIERAADVTLKERRPLLLAAREAPLSLIHLRNMTAATEAGAMIFPVTPAFYDRALTGEQAARQFLARMLAHLGLRRDDAFQWRG